MSTEQNKQVIRRWLEELWNRSNAKVADEIFAPEYVRHDGKGDQIRGPSGVRHLLAAYRAAFPDMHFREDSLIAEGDQVAIRWTAIGTHLGDFQGLPATGRRGVITGMDIFRLADGKIVESWPSQDQLEMLEQLGFMPPPTVQKLHAIALKGAQTIRSLALLRRRAQETRSVR